MNSLSPHDILAVWEQGHGRRPFEQALLLARLANPGVSEAELAKVPIAERDAMLLDLRERVLGRRLTGFAVCPGCGQDLELPLETPEIREKVSRPSAPQEAAIGAFRFLLRWPSSSDLAAIASTDLPAARLALAARCIREVSRDGTGLEVRDVPESMLSRLADFMEEMEDPSEIMLDIRCTACAHSWQVAFDVASYFYTELAVLARRLLEEVHVLASAYGWSERDILSLSPARRQFYLERVR